MVWRKGWLSKMEKNGPQSADLRTLRSSGIQALECTSVYAATAKAHIQLPDTECLVRVSGL